jgi:F-type H+-transporting ATPase subunit gamma
VKKLSLVLVTGDRGLCGSYNSAVIKAATKRIQKLTDQGIAVSDSAILTFSYRDHIPINSFGSYQLTKTFLLHNNRPTAFQSY